MNAYIYIACHVLAERIERNNKILKGASDPAIIQMLQDENKACEYTVKHLGLEIEKC